MVTSMSSPILVADIGGTNARFAIAERHGDQITLSENHTVRVADFERFTDALGGYLKSVSANPRQAVLAAAGPVFNQTVVFTNSPWRLDGAEIKSGFGFEHCAIVNDFYALASGVAFLDDDAFAPVKAGDEESRAPVLVLGPGTGLGQALLVPMSEHQRIVATEGGHIAFAPQTDEERFVEQYIARETHRVVVEQVLSGTGLTNIYRALCELNGAPETAMGASAITAAAMVGDDPIAVQTVEMFCAVLGAVVGDAVLSTGARGGVVLGGGILPKIKGLFLASDFANRFVQKAAMQKYMASVPVRLVIEETAALIGAAASASD